MSARVDASGELTDAELTEYCERWVSGERLALRQLARAIERAERRRAELAHTRGIARASAVRADVARSALSPAADVAFRLYEWRREAEARS